MIHLVDDHVPFFNRVPFEQIETHRTFLEHIKKYDVFGPIFRDSRQDRFHHVPVRIDNEHAVSLCNILKNHVGEKHTLAGAGGPYDEHVPHPILVGQVHRLYSLLMKVVEEGNVFFLCGIGAAKGDSSRSPTPYGQSGRIAAYRKGQTEDSGRFMA